VNKFDFRPVISGKTTSCSDRDSCFSTGSICFHSRSSSRVVRESTHAVKFKCSFE